jgi:hypothetical protein
MQMKKVLLVFLLILVSVSSGKAQDTLKWRAGITAGAGLNIHSSDFQNLPGIPNCCEKFSGGLGGGMYFGGLFEYPVADKFLAGFRASYRVLSGELTAEEEEIMMSQYLTPITGTFTHFLKAEITEVGIAPMVIWQPTPGLNLHLGGRFAYMLDADFEQYEEIGASDDFIFSDTRSKVRNEFSGELPNNSRYMYSLILGAGYEFPLNKEGTMLLQPEIFYMQGLSPVIEDYTWNIGQLSAGVSLKITAPKEKPLEHRSIDIFQVDTLYIEKEGVISNKFGRGERSAVESEYVSGDTLYHIRTISAVDTFYIPPKEGVFPLVRLVGIDYDGGETERPTFKIEEFITNKYMPVLNYIFFDENSSEIPARYNRLRGDEANRFEVANLQHDEFDNHRDVLNILGKRLSENGDFKITLTGCNAGTGKEKENLELSRQRAESVKRYLVETWGINPENIKTEARNLPEKPSTPLDEKNES